MVIVVSCCCVAVRVLTRTGLHIGGSCVCRYWAWAPLCGVTQHDQPKKTIAHNVDFRTQRRGRRSKTLVLSIEGNGMRVGHSTHFYVSACAHRGCRHVLRGNRHTSFDFQCVLTHSTGPAKAHRQACLARARLRQEQPDQTGHVIQAP